MNEKNTTYEMILLIAIDKYKVSKEHFFSFASLDHKYGPAHHWKFWKFITGQGKTHILFLNKEDPYQTGS